MVVMKKIEYKLFNLPFMLNIATVVIMKLPLDKIIDDYNQLQQKLISVTDTKEMIKLSKAVSVEQVKFDLASELIQINKEVEEAKQSLEGSTDEEMNSMMDAEIVELNARIPEVQEKLLTYLTPKDERDDKDVLMEIKAGAGGDESALFAQELLKSYQMMAGQLGLKFNITSAATNDLGGYRDVEIEIKGNNAFSWYKYEGGVHRVQRVPTTEKQGRVHTSTIAVIVSPLLEEDTTEFKLDMQEVEVVATTSQGAGGQSVNTTYSAIKVKHFPTGIIAQCQDERNQQQNRIKALQVLTSRVYNHFQEIKLAAESKERKDQVGTMDRSEKIRTYNFPQDRLTDHRFNNNWNQLPIIMTGGILKVVEDIKKIDAQRTLEAI
jgi:peptide chain release factor 1